MKIRIATLLVALLAAAAAAANWGPEGYLELTASTGATAAALCPVGDGSGDVYAVWSVASQTQLRANRITAAGDTLWGARGVLIAEGDPIANNARAFSDERGNLYVSYSRVRLVNQIGPGWMQKVSPAGLRQWGRYGSLVDAGANRLIRAVPTGGDELWVVRATFVWDNPAIAQYSCLRLDSMGRPIPGSAMDLFTNHDWIGTPIYASGDGRGGITIAVNHKWWLSDTLLAWRFDKAGNPASDRNGEALMATDAHPYYEWMTPVLFEQDGSFVSAVVSDQEGDASDRVEIMKFGPDLAPAWTAPLVIDDHDMSFTEVDLVQDHLGYALCEHNRYFPRDAAIRRFSADGRWLWDGPALFADAYAGIAFQPDGAGNIIVVQCDNDRLFTRTIDSAGRVSAEETLIEARIDNAVNIFNRPQVSAMASPSHVLFSIVLPVGVDRSLLFHVGEGELFIAPKSLPAAAVAPLVAAPNPFNPSTSISFSLERPSDVVVDVLDLRGRLVRRLATGRMDAGEHAVTWTGVDGAGRRVPSGVYLARLRAGDRDEVLKMNLVK
jgi:hypothetical protein